MLAGNIYKDEPTNFEELALACPSLQQYIIPLGRTQDGQKKSSTIDFSNEEAVEELTKSILKRDFGVHWERPPGSLIPPVPNRLNYILWLKDLLELDARSLKKGVDGVPHPVKGIDIGTGGSLIYALLGAAHCGWYFLATEVHNYSLEWARKNRLNNPHLEQMIEIHDAKEDDNRHAILVGVVGQDEQYDFCMCNPPFFDIGEKRQLHKPGHGGLANELHCEGGEEAFIMQILKDSQQLKDRITWYTTMIGKKKTLKKFKGHLFKLKDTSAIRTTTFVQGRTTRWGVAWSFSKRFNKSHLSKRKRGDEQVLPHEGSEQTIAFKFGLLRRSALTKNHAFTVHNSARGKAFDVKQRFLQVLKNKLVWDGTIKVNHEQGFQIQIEEESPFHLLCHCSIPDTALPSLSLQPQAHEQYQDHSQLYSKMSLSFQVHMYEYGGSISIQSTLSSSCISRTHMQLFHAILSCVTLKIRNSN